jgi:hypothetical protein
MNRKYFPKRFFLFATNSIIFRCCSVFVGLFINIFIFRYYTEPCFIGYTLEINQKKTKRNDEKKEKHTWKLRTFGTFHSSIMIPIKILIRTMVFVSLSMTYNRTIKLWNRWKNILRMDKP